MAAENGDEPTRPISKNGIPTDADQIAYVELYRPKTIISSSSNDHSFSITSTNLPSSNSNNSSTKNKKRRAPLKKYHILFLTIYLYQIYWIYSTIGLPYKEFLDKAEREGFEGWFIIYCLLCLFL